MLRTGGPLLLLLAVGVAGFWLLHDGNEDHEVTRDREAERPDDGNNPPAQDGPANLDAVPFRVHDVSTQALRGTVKSPSGQPVAGVLIENRAFVGNTTAFDPIYTERLRSDAHGQFDIRAPDGNLAAFLQLAVADTHHVGHPVRLSVFPGATPPNPVLIAHPLDTMRTIRVVGSDGMAIGDGRVTIESGQVLHTDSSGEVQVPVSRSFRPLLVIASAPGRASASRLVGHDSGSQADIEVTLHSGTLVAGTVTDNRGGRLAGVVVKHVGWLGKRAESDQEGRFRIDGLATNRPHRFIFNKNGYLPLTVPVEDLEVITPLDVQMTPGVAIKGLVTSTDGTPLVGALVTIGKDPVGGRAHATTGIGGHFSIAGARGEVTLQVSYPQRIPHEELLVASSSTPELRIQLREGGRLFGRVTGREGIPISDANVMAYRSRPEDLGPPVTTDQDGRFSFTGLPPSGINLQVRAAGFAPVFRSDIVLDGKELEITLVRTPTISGVVQDQEGQPVTRFRVALERMSINSVHSPGPWRWPGRTVKDSEGRFSTDRAHLEPGAIYRIEITADGYQTHTIERHQPVAEGGHPLQIRLRQGGELSGRVVDESGNPVAEAMVAPRTAFASDPGGGDRTRGPRAVSDQDGKYVLSGLPTGEVEIEARHPGHAPANVKEVVDAGSPRALPDLVLIHAGTLVIQVNAGENGLGRTRVVLAQEGTDERESTLNPDGSVRIPWLPVGRWTVALHSDRPDLHGLEAGVEIQGGDTRRMVFQPVSPLCDVIGDVTIDGQTAGNGVKIVLEPHAPEMQPIQARTGTDGRFIFKDLAPGPYRLVASFQIGTTTFGGELKLILEAGERRVTLKLQTR